MRLNCNIPKLAAAAVKSFLLRHSRQQPKRPPVHYRRRGRREKVVP